jgi:hypothetical protein
MNVCKTRKKNGVGETSSIYGYNNGGELFEQDILKRSEEGEALYQEFVSWMKSKNVDPRKFRTLFSLYFSEFIEGDKS